MKYEHTDSLKLQLSQYFLENSSIPTYWIDSHARFVYANKAGYETLDYDRDEFFNMYIYEIERKHDKAYWKEFWDKLKEKKLISFETELTKKNGETNHVQLQTNYIEYNNKSYVIAHAIDISRQKTMEKLFRHTKNLLDMSSTAIYLIDNNAEIIQVNKKSCDMLNYTEYELLNMNY